MLATSATSEMMEIVERAVGSRFDELMTLISVVRALMKQLETQFRDALGTQLNQAEARVGKLDRMYGMGAVHSAGSGRGCHSSPFGTFDESPYNNGRWRRAGRAHTWEYMRHPPSRWEHIGRFGCGRG